MNIYMITVDTLKECSLMGKYNRYDDEFKQNLVNLYQSGKTQTDIAKEYGVSASALTRWVKQFSEVRLDDDQILTIQQIKQLQKRNAKLEEENLILKKAIAIFTPQTKSE